MNYTLNQLKIFLKVTQSMSITKAAEELHLTQPAVSIQLKNFQDQFEIPLIEVINKKIYVTEFGKEIAEAVEKILEEAKAINFKMHAHNGQLTGKLKISSVSTGKYIAPYFVADFMKKNQGVELFLDVTNMSQVIISLENNEIDFAFVSTLPEHMPIGKVELMPNNLFLMGNNPLTPVKKMHDKKVFETIPLIYREPGSGTRHVMEKFIISNKIRVEKKLELTSNEAVKQAVISGLGYSIMPLIGVKNEIQNKQLQIIPVKGLPIKSLWTLIWLKKKKLSPIAEAYLSYIKKEKENIMKKQFSWFENFSQ